MTQYDTLIRDAKIVDGMGNPWFRGDVALTGDKIAEVAPGGLNAGEARETVEADGRVVCPGFIDIQSHSIAPFLTDGRSLSKVMQGVTTEIMGELWTPAPWGGRRQTSKSPTYPRFRDWLDSLTAKGISVNFGSFVGGATVREWAKGWDIGEPTEAEMDEMRSVTVQAMEDGAFGVATALIYPPNSYSPDSELLEIAKVVAQYRGVYITHIRSEGDRFLESLAETIELGRQSNAPVEIYHLKASGERNWPKMADAIGMIDDARADGVDITADMYPYVASGTGLNVLVPNWASEGGRLYENLRDPATRARIYDDMISGRSDDGDSAYNKTYDHVMPIGFQLPEHRAYLGLRLPEIAARRGQDWANATLDLLAAEGQRIGTVFFSMSEDNLRLQLCQPWIKISTDAGGIDPAGQTTPVHPRGYGTYPRVLGKYVREEKILTLEDAVRKMSGAVAARLGIFDRGILRAGASADVVVFDPDTVADRATFTAPHQLSVGIDDVWVNGTRVVKDGSHTGALPGRAVYGAGRRG